MKNPFFALALAPILLPACALAQTAETPITHLIRDFGPRGFDYGYGPNWKPGENIKPEGDGVKIDTNEAGGAGLVLNGVNLTPNGQTHLAVRAKLLEGSGKPGILLKLNGPGADKSVTLDLSQFNSEGYTTVLMPLPSANYEKVAQIQFQGTNWGGGQPIKLLIDRIGTTSADEKANQTAIEKAKEAAKNNPRAGAPAKALPNVAGWGFYPPYPDAWMTFLNQQLDRAKQAREKKDLNVAFIGDSITQGWWEGGKELWDAKYKPLGAANFGIGGDSTRQVLYRLDKGILDGVAPKVVVLKIGTNNLYDDFNAGSDAEIADGIKAVVAKIKEKAPTSKILLLGILPRENAWFSGRIAKINAQIAPLADGKTVRFLDMGPQFATNPEKGEVIPALYKGDKLHLVKAGYEAWDAAMWPTLSEMLK